MNKNIFKFNEKEYDLAEIISDKDCFTLDDVNKPIITRSGITKIAEKFSLIDSTIEPNVLNNFPAPYEYMITVTVTLYDSINNAYFTGDGEASAINLAPGLAKQYPLAMAVKRARSRAILNYLHIDALSEDEAPNLSSALRKVGISDKEISQEDKDAINEAAVKKYLTEQIKALAATMNPPLGKEEIEEFFKKSNGIPIEQHIGKQELTSESLTKTLFNLRMYTIMDPDTATFFMNKLNENNAQDNNG